MELGGGGSGGGTEAGGGGRPRGGGVEEGRGSFFLLKITLAFFVSPQYFLHFFDIIHVTIFCFRLSVPCNYCDVLFHG